MNIRWLPYWICLWIACGGTVAKAQLDPEKRRLLQLGYNQPMEGKGPIAGYVFFYLNDPEFIRTNLALRLAIAPVYLDSELGIRHILGQNTDLGIGLAGGGFGDSYSEIRQGKLWQEESFAGHGFETGLTLYHRFNPESKIPLNGLLRGTFNRQFFYYDTTTDRRFDLPDNQSEFRVRSGLRWGGQEPLVFPDLAMELSGWYEGIFRNNPRPYGYAEDRFVEGDAHLFWARALFAYILPESKQKFSVSLTTGASIGADRLSAYRLGGVLPLVSEYPLNLPGYYWQELSAERFVLLNAHYSIPIDPAKCWSLMFYGGTALVDYLPGMEQPGNWNSGVGGGISYHSPSRAWLVMLGYAYGIDAIRSHGRGANSIGLILQFDLEAQFARNPSKSRPRVDPNWIRGLDWVLGR